MFQHRSFEIGLENLISENYETQVRYWEMRLDGQSHKIAELLATQSFPSIRTDATFNKGRCNGNQFENTPGQGDHYRGIAESQGVSTTGKHYSPALADFPGDPTAWIADRSDVLRIAKQKGLKVSGAVEYDPGEVEPMPDIEIDPEIVDRHVAEYMTLDSGERKEDVHEKLYNLLAGKVDPNPLLVDES